MYSIASLGLQRDKPKSKWLATIRAERKKKRRIASKSRRINRLP